MPKPIGPDQFALAMEEILSEIGDGVRHGATDAVRKGLRKGASEWRKNAKDQIGEHEYKRHGVKYTSGAYVKSIRSHVTDKHEDHPEGEVGSPSLPGLPHLLEFGHARVGGGRVRAIPHVAEAAEEAFKATEEALGANIDEVMRG